MPRPTCCRRVAATPACLLFKPAGVPCSALEQLVLTVDELESLRLADLEGLYQEQAATRMGVSRATFGRIVESARKKVARMLVEAKALRIEGGVFQTPEPGGGSCGGRGRGRCRRGGRSPGAGARDQ